MKSVALRTILLISALCLGSVSATAQGSTAQCMASTNTGQSFFGNNITSGFGNRKSVSTTAGTEGGMSSSFHRGLDLSVKGNPNVGSFMGGKVETGTSSGYGNWVSVTNGPLSVFYGHAGSLNVQTGQTISAGQTLGNWANCTGKCTGPHVHLEYRIVQEGVPAHKWPKVDPMIAQALIDANGGVVTDAILQEALEKTMNGCDVPLDALLGGAGAGGYVNEIDEMCNPNIRSQLVTLNNATVAFRQNAMQQIVVPPPAPSMIANTPCHSKELQRVSDKFASMPGDMMGGMMGGSDPISGIMNQFFEAGMSSINKAAESIPGMANFQTLASEQLGNLLSGLGLGGAFSSELCGMMVDMVVNFLECQFPLEMPEMPSFDLGFGSLNDLLPKGCAGNAMREGLYKAADSLPNLTQSFSAPK